MQKRIGKITIKHIPDDCSCADYLVSDIDDLAKSVRYSQKDIDKYGLDKVEEWIKGDMERFKECGVDWIPIGIKAVAEIQTSEDGKSWLLNTIESGGLWCVESDSGDDYLKEVGDDQIAGLKKILEGMGFSLKGVPIITEPNEGS